MAYYEHLIVIKEGTVRCILCNELVPDNNEYIKIHLNSEIHRRTYLKRLFVNNNIFIDSNRVYCFMCKLPIGAVPEIMTHISGSKHQNFVNAIRNVIEEDGAFLEWPETDGTTLFCSICKQNVDFTFDAVKDHIDSIAHRRARSIVVQPYNGIFSVEDSDEDLWCKICELYFENYIEIIFEHVDEDKKHLAKLKKILRLIDGQNITIEKYLTDPKEDKAFCRKCKIEVACNVDNLERHIKGRKHTTH